jgi:hypothetical protein|tara:strand:+ start:8061 stop:8492 length:432 start_codon:yes stop_codon:yes gene_type:complete
MSETYESIRLSGAERNVERLGVFVAWLVCNHLLDPILEKSIGSAVARLRLQDLTGPEFLTTILHGELKPTHLNEAGRGFTEAYFVSGRFNADYGASDYSGEDEWLRYDEVSPKITSAFRQHCAPKQQSKSGGAKIIPFPTRKQ